MNEYYYGFQHYEKSTLAEILSPNYAKRCSTYGEIVRFKNKTDLLDWLKNGGKREEVTLAKAVNLLRNEAGQHILSNIYDGVYDYPAPNGGD